MTREVDNQQGKDASYDEVSASIPQPLKFHRQRARDVFHRRDGALRVNAHENRFIPINDTTVVNSKFAKYSSPGFENWAEHSVEEFLCNPSNCRNDNVNHIYHDAKHVLVHKDLSAGVPKFERYITREENPEKTTCLGMKVSPIPYDQVKVHTGYHMAHKQNKDVVPFKLLQGRDNLYQRMHGLPKHSKEEIAAVEKKYQENVDYKEFLPNSIARSPKRNTFSNSFKTKTLNLYRTQSSARSTRNTMESTPKQNLSNLDLDPEINKRKLHGRLEPKLLEEKINRRM